jgi:hypothetical protein
VNFLVRPLCEMTLWMPKNSKSFTGALFICCLLVDQSLHLARCSSLSRVIIRHNPMCGHFSFKKIWFVSLFFYAPTSASRMAFHRRYLGQMQLPIQVFCASSVTWVSQPGFTQSHSVPNIYFDYLAKHESSQLDHGPEPGIVLGSLCFM